MRSTRKIVFVLPQQKSNGLVIQDELLKEWKPEIVTFANGVLDEENEFYEGWFHNSNTGEIDFTAYGGLADGTLTMQCSKI